MRVQPRFGGGDLRRDLAVTALQVGDLRPVAASAFSRATRARSR